MKIPMLNLRREYEYMKHDIDAAISRCLEHQQWILGPEVKELEGKIAEYIGVKHCVTVSSGTDALVLALRALAIKTKGEEYFDRSDLVITTPFTFTATGDTILRAGATPVFVDIDPATYNIDPLQIRKFLGGSSRPNRRGSRLVGIVPVHLYGQSCEMDQIMGIADELGLWVVEDVAQAFGASFHGQKLGSIGTCGAFSFFPSKNLGGFGDGGMVSTNDAEMNELVRALLKHGGKDKYNVEHIGYNARLDTLQAAILLARLKYVDEFNSRRECNASNYTERLQGIEGIVLPLKYPTGLNTHVFHQYTIRVKHERRDWLQYNLKQNGIDTMVYYPVPLNRMGLFKKLGGSDGHESKADIAAKQVLSLPIEPLMAVQDIDRVAYNIKNLLDNALQGKG